ncbi:UNVERIFIED_CONTAM: hypothetical protein K2H54_007429 [Gekko kuhli]
MPAIKRERPDREELALAAFNQPMETLPDYLVPLAAAAIPVPFFDNGEPCLEVECGENKALLYIHKLCQGSKGPSIRYRGEWLTPNEFQFVSGRETAKDWKRSIRHKGLERSSRTVGR